MKFWKKEQFREIEYQPTSVKDLLVEMKDISELVVDLAYSAVIFGDDDIAEEVKLLEARIDTLKYQIRLTAMVASRTVEDAEQLSGILQVSMAAEKISNAAGDIVNVQENLPGTRLFLYKMLERGDERILRARVSGDSTMVGKTIKELKIETETGVRIVAVRRNDIWIYGPEPNLRFRDDDVLIVRGVLDGFNRLHDFAKGECHEL